MLAGSQFARRGIPAIHRCLQRMHDLSELQYLRPQAAPVLWDHAVVLGASWTGMLAAAVLAPYCGRVTILERDGDVALDARGPRRGVPHGAQSHVFLQYAVTFTRHLLPNFDAALRAAGGEAGGDMGTDFAWFHRGRWRLRQPLGLPMWFATRPLVEHTVRQQVLRQHVNVSLMSNARAVGFTGRPQHLDGVQIERDGQALCVTASLVVDCTGKRSQTARWLAALGCGDVPTCRVDAATFYATRRFVRREAETTAATRHWALAWHGHPHGTRCGHFAGAVTVENHETWVWGVRTGQPLPPRDEDFAAFFHGMGTAALAMHVHGTTDAPPQPCAPARAFGPGPALRRDFSALRHHPDNFVALGDAVCATNPAFGLGLSLSASTVACLAAALADQVRSRKGMTRWLRRRPVSISFGADVAERVAWRTLGPWLLTIAEDYRLPHTQGPHKGRLWVRALQWYVDGAFHIALQDASVDALVLRVVSLMAHPLQVFSLSLMRRVGARALKLNPVLPEVNCERSH